jgi:putative ABC transport system substrate-binding protein
MHTRRDFSRALIGAATAPLMVPRVARAQQRMPVIGYLTAVRQVAFYANPFLKGLAETGFVEGRNVVIERRSADGHYERLPALAKELVQRKVSVIAVVAPVAALAAKAATSTIPIVFELGSDPVKDGLVSSFARPGGNLTGVTFFNNLLAAKRVELLRDMLPKITAVALLLNPENANAALELSDAQAGARALGLRLVVIRVTTDQEIVAAFAQLAREKITAALLAADAWLSSRRARTAALALRHGIATCHGNRPSVEVGGLVSYSASREDSARQFGLYVGRVLKGEKPADLPVVQPTKFELVINLKTAKALGLTVSRELLLRADEVIE